MARLFVLIILFLVACNNRSSNSGKTHLEPTKNIESEAVDQTKDLKDLSYYKEAYLYTRSDKAIDILGKPDDEGESTSGRAGHYVYYDRIKDKGKVKHLVIWYHYNPYEDNLKTIKLVDAVEDGKYFHQERYGRVLIKKPNGFGDEFKNVDKKITDINSAFNELDTNKLNKYTDIIRGVNTTFYYTDDLKLRLVKDVVSLGNDNNRITLFFYLNDEIKYIFNDYTRPNSLMSEKKYVINNKVVRYLKDDKEYPCQYDCEFDKYTEPYHLLDHYYNAQGD